MTNFSFVLSSAANFMKTNFVVIALMGIILTSCGNQNRSSTESSTSYLSERLNTLGKALHSYHEKNGHFPQSAIFNSKEKIALLSWRVELLPYLGQETLYNKIKKQEPWNSPNNLPILKEMPEFFSCESNNGNNSNSCFSIPLVSNNKLGATYFSTDPFFKSSFELATDGNSNSILIFLGKAEPWTRPQEQVIDLEKVDFNIFSKVFPPIILLGDGSVRILNKSLDSTKIRAFLTINGIEKTNASFELMP